MFSIRRHSISACGSVFLVSGCTSLLVAFAGCGGFDGLYSDTTKVVDPVTVAWSTPAAHTTLSGTATLAVTGANLVNVEFFQGSAMVARAQVADDHRSATAAFDTTQLADGPISLSAHAWNGPAGTPSTSEADAGVLALVVDNTGTDGTDGVDGTDGTVMVGWSAPANHATLAGTATLAVTGANFINVEFFQGSTMIVRAQVAADHRSATASFDTTRLADGPINLTAHAWNSPAGTSFTSEADAGVRALVVDNGGSGGSGGSASGLPWRSGASTDGLAAFETWRAHELDVFETWPNRDSWDQIRNPDIYGAVSAFNGRAGTLSIGIAMLPEDNSGTFGDCATGLYDQYYKDIGSKLVSLGRGDSFVRLGWEANGDWYAWKIGSDAKNYINCFRKEATALRSTAPGVRIDWNMNKDSHITGSVADAYPGDAWVDVIGVDFYDAWPAYPTQSAWDGDYDATQNGGPRGIGSWLAFAQAHGKPLSLPEWGLSNAGDDGGGTDNPLYIQNIFSFLQTNAAHIAYEAYFNLQGADFMILPAGKNPNGSAKYKSLF
jgi:hypothetical protein